MLSGREERIVRSEFYTSFVKRRNRLSCFLVTLLIGMVLVLDIISMTHPGFMGGPAWEGTVLSRGLFFAFFIVCSIVVSAFYYIHWINVEFSRLEKLMDEETGETQGEINE